MKKINLIILSFFLAVILFNRYSNESDGITGNAQYIEHGSTQLYEETDKYGVVYIYLGDNYSVGNINSYKVKDIDNNSNSPINIADKFIFKKGMLCIPLNNSGVSVGDTLVFKHKHNTIGNLEVVAVEDNNSANLSSEELYKYK